MLNINRFLLTFFSFLFFSTIVFGQKINQTNVNGERDGVWKKYYKNNKIRYSGQFKNGKEIGVFKFYDIADSSHPIIVKEYTTTSDTAFVKFYTLRGKMRSKGTMIGKKRVGKWIYYFVDSGKIFSEENYNNGKLDGVVRNYYPNGKVTEETYYKNGVKNGTSKTYTDDGLPLEEVNYTNNKLNGEAKYFDLKGNLTEKGNYKDGKKTGKWDFYINGEKVKNRKQKKHAVNKK